MRIALKYIKTLEQIVSLEGDCSEYSLCLSCPFKGSCLPAFLGNKPRPSELDRKNMAVDALTRAVLLVEDSE